MKTDKLIAAIRAEIERLDMSYMLSSDTIETTCLSIVRRSLEGIVETLQKPADE